MYLEKYWNSEAQDRNKESYVLNHIKRYLPVIHVPCLADPSPDNG